LFDFDHFSFEDFSNITVFLELHNYDLLAKLVGLSLVQASIDVVGQPSCLYFIIFQSTCPNVTIGQTYCSSLDVNIN
jgi:hypothetical protein